MVAIKNEIVKVTSGRKITLPALLCSETGINIGDHVVVKVKNNNLTIVPVDIIERKIK